MELVNEVKYDATTAEFAESKGKLLVTDEGSKLEEYKKSEVEIN
jgi:hypothetical protein